MSAAVDFPHSVNDEPTGEWTIEQLLHWCLLQSERRTNDRRDELIAALREQLEEGKKVLMEAHEMAAQASAEESGGGGGGAVEEDEVQVVGVVPASNTGGAGEENVIPAPTEVENKAAAAASSNSKSAKPSKATANATKKAKATKPAGIKTVYAEVIDGLYAGQTFELKPKPRSPCFIGRSAGKKFRDRGISMPNDGEVSTTHGKVEVKGGKAYYTDVGSTNGTLLEGEELETNVPLLITDGIELLIGAETVKFTLGY